MPRLKYITSFNELEKHAYDDYKNLGYNYKLHILKNVLSQELFGNPLNDLLYRLIEKIIEYLIEQVKYIKVFYAYTYNKNDKNLN